MATESVSIAQRDFVELREDVSASPLWNRDLAPTTISQRTWSTYNIAALWIGMSVVISTYLLASGLISQGMNWWQALLTILLGNIIVLIPMALNAHAGTKYGISFPVLCRASFGTWGANIPGLLRAIVACGWFGIQTWIGGGALDALLSAAWPQWQEIAGHTWIAFFVFWGIQVAILLRGIEGIKYLESWGAPLLLAGGLLLLVWAVTNAGGISAVLGGAQALYGQGAHNPFWKIFWPALTANVGYWATLSLNIPDFTRFAKSQRSQILGQALGLPPTMLAFSFLGVAVTSATVVMYGQPIWDPVVLVSTKLNNPLIVVFSMLIVIVAQITTNMAANVVAPATGISNLSPQRISFRLGSIITALIGIAMMPWRLMESAGAYIFTWLIGYSSLMGGLGGILICDYWALRKQKLSLKDLFDVNGRYSYSGGVNWRAVLALAIAIAPVVPGFINAATTPGGVVQNPGFFDTLYTYAWFVTFAISFAVYWLLMKGQIGAWGCIAVIFIFSLPMYRSASASAIQQQNKQAEQKAPAQPKSAAQLIAQLKDPDPKARREAAGSLAGVADESAVEPLIAALSDSDAEVRELSAFVLGLLGDGRAQQQLLKLLKDDEPAVRSSTAFALGMLKSDDALDSLIELLDDKDVDVRYEAVFALSEIGGERALEALIRVQERLMASVQKIKKANEYDFFRAVLDALNKLTENAAPMESFGGIPISRETGELTPDAPPVGSSPRIIDRPRIHYTERARKAKVAGTVVVRALFEADKTISQVRVLRRVGYGLDMRAVEGMLRTKFDPATRDGKPIAMHYSLRVNFRP